VQNKQTRICIKIWT